ncbi:carnosine N-methyltransferase isoform X2 [Glossina fuscipes]|uniref:carnosine N-methyltransferase n=1 Tax=Glossina fuscipes TaxID=7396 RepID=A0A9C6DYY6_9MUSC|nr:carnosine N-methyltransferase isoform X2 [Glossina fuscipes]KAI9590756.1 hypothetical protein GQX74_008923 [Glossina fuscipes]
MCDMPSTSLNELHGMTSDSAMLNPEVAEEERQNLQKIIAALRYYRTHLLNRVNKTTNYLNSLPKRHQDMLVKYRHHLNVVRDCIDKNQMVIKKMLRDNLLLGGGNAGPEITQKDLDGHATKIRHQDMEHAQSTLKAIARDWSMEGAEEREQSYKPIIDAIEHYYNPKDLKINEIKILVPGSGLGRLTYELACRGYECEGNEFSYFMLLASNFVLNCCKEENMHTLYPWVHQNVNNLHRADQVAAVRFPDVCPDKNKPTGLLSIVAGDFLEVYKAPSCFHCVATCFFIDCANNVVDFIETIYNILMPGGIWVNLGPLLYHFSDVPNEQSIEPTYEDILHIISCIGFEVLTSKSGIRTKYAQNPQSMLKSEYESLFWICRKPLTNTIEAAVDGMQSSAEIRDERCDINGYNEC